MRTEIYRGYGSLMVEYPASNYESRLRIPVRAALIFSLYIFNSFCIQAIGAKEINI